MVHIRLFVGVVSILFFIATFEFIRKGRLREEYAILWLSTSSIIAILSLWPGLIKSLSDGDRPLLHHGGPRRSSFPLSSPS